MATLTNIPKTVQEQIDWISDALDTYLVGATETDTFVTQNASGLTNIARNSASLTNINKS